MKLFSDESVTTRALLYLMLALCTLSFATSWSVLRFQRDTMQGWRETSRAIQLEILQRERARDGAFDMGIPANKPGS